jgi:VWFA-related protein
LSVFRSRSLALGFALGSCISLLAQQPLSQPGAPPTFTTSTELVRVDFVVSDRADRSVKGLTAKDFVVKEDGKQRPIVQFEAFAGNRASLSASSGLPQPPSPDAASSLTPPPAPGAATVLLVDDAQMSLEQAARLRPALVALLSKLADRNGSGNGSVMLVAPASNVSLVAQLPRGGADLAPAVDRVVGHRSAAHADDAAFPVADAEALAIARGELEPLARVTGRFMALNPELNDDQAKMLARERGNELAHDVRTRRDAMYDATLLCLDWLQSRAGRHSLILVSAGYAADPDDSRYKEVVTRSLLTNAPIHFLDVRGLSGISSYQGAEFGPALNRHQNEGPFGWSQAAEGSTNLADETGGITISNTNDIEKGLGRLFDTISSYYLLAYQPVTGAKPGYHKISVEVRTKGLHVRARRGYFSGGPSGRSAITTTSTAATIPGASPTTDPGTEPGSSPRTSPSPAPTPSPAPAPGTAPAPGAMTDEDVARVLVSAGSYVDDFQRQLTGIVMEESYTQDFSSSSMSRTGQYAPAAHRELKSDLLLIRPGNGTRDVEFRDVFEVDGHTVRDREERLTRLFLDSSKSATNQLRAIIAESARYNIGSVERTMNTPTLPLFLLLSTSQPRLTFKLTSNSRPTLSHSLESVDGTPASDLLAPSSAVVFAFEEQPHDTLIQTPRGKALPSKGRFWVDPGTGQVLMSELVVEDPSVRAVVDVSYRVDPEIQLLVPAEMRERYEGLRNGALVEGRATYGRFRRFQVKVDTDIKR